MYMIHYPPSPTSLPSISMLSFRLRMLNAATNHIKEQCARQCWTMLLCAYSKTAQGTTSQLKTISTSLSFKLRGPFNQLPEMVQSVIKQWNLISAYITLDCALLTTSVRMLRTHVAAMQVQLLSRIIITLVIVLQLSMIVHVILRSYMTLQQMLHLKT